MKRWLGLLGLIAAPALAQVAIENPWARATAPGAKIAAGYLVVKNSGAADRLVGASSPAAARVELHVHVNEGGVMKMREASGYDIPANGTFELRPGGAHLMFVDIRRPFVEGERIPVTLKFEKAGEIRAEFHVGRLGASGPAHKH
ncbi:MAG: copper chaperone PCu(A)C [Pseudomonadota bacterium]